MRSLHLALLVLLATAPLGDAARAEEDAEEVAGPFPWTETEGTFFLRRIVDGITGKPIAGATVKLLTEVPHPQPGFGTPSAVATTGPDGWARIRRDQLDPKRTATYGEPSWAYVEARGFGPDAVMNEFVKDDDWRLRAASELRVTLHDPVDRPVAGALVGWLLGCGHTPDVRQATTDAHGVARVLDVQASGFGQTWFVKDGFISRYLDPERWLPWERERIAHVEASPVIEGIVLRHDGTPAAGVAVGRSDSHRGPWTRTDACGKFRLVGIQSRVGDDLFVEWEEYPVSSKGGTARLLLPTPPPGLSAKAILPSPSQEPVEVARTSRLVVEVEWPEGVDRKELDVGVVAVRTSDGWQEDDAVGAQGVALLDVPPGRFHIVVEASSHEVPVHRIRTEVEVPASGGAHARVTLPPVGVLTLACDLENAHVSVVVDGAAHLVDLDSATRPYRLLLDPSKPHALRITQGPRSRVVPVGPAHLLPNAGAIRVPGFASVGVRARLVDPEGHPVPGWLFDEDTSEALVAGFVPGGLASETPSTETPEGDRVDLLAWPEDSERLQPLRLPRRTLVAQAGPVDLGVVRLPARAPALTVHGLDGKILEVPEIEVRLAGRQDTLAAEEERWQFRDPWWAPGLLIPGAVVRVHPPVVQDDPGGPEVWPLAFSRRLEGPGPWILTPPRGSLVLDVTVPDNEALESAEIDVHLDGKSLSLKNRARVLGLEAGQHEVVVEAEGMRAQRLRFTLRDGEERRWTVRLRPMEVNR